MTTNCPNCGAPIDISRSSCEYCGTPYPEKPETAKFYADNQLVMEVQIESNKRSDELLKQLIDRDRLLHKACETIRARQPITTAVEHVNLIDQFKYERKKELIHDILCALILFGPGIIAGIITWFLIY